MPVIFPKPLPVMSCPSTSMPMPTKRTIFVPPVTMTRMPAIITHDFFGRDVYDRLFALVGGSRDEAHSPSLSLR